MQHNKQGGDGGGGGGDRKFNQQQRFQSKIEIDKTVSKNLVSGHSVWSAGVLGLLLCDGCRVSSHGLG